MFKKLTPSEDDSPCKELIEFAIYESQPTFSIALLNDINEYLFSQWCVIFYTIYKFNALNVTTCLKAEMIWSALINGFHLFDVFCFSMKENLMSLAIKRPHQSSHRLCQIVRYDEHLSSTVLYKMHFYEDRWLHNISGNCQW